MATTSTKQPAKKEETGPFEVIFYALAFIIASLFVSNVKGWQIAIAVAALFVGLIWGFIRLIRPKPKQAVAPSVPQTKPAPPVTQIQVEPPLAAIPAIAPVATTIFDAADVEPPSKPMPPLKGEWLSIGDDQKALIAYSNYVDTHRNEIDNLHQKAIDIFTSDYKRVHEQQKMAVRRAAQANTVLARFTDLPPLDSISIDSVPQLQQIIIPKIPNYKTPAQLAEAYLAPSGFATRGISNLASRQAASGKADVTTLVTAIVVSIAAQAIEAKIGLSKYTRALEEVIGKVGMIAEETKESMQSLGRGHQTLVTSSNELFKANAEIEALVQRAQQIPTSMTTMAELPQNQRKTIETLLVWVAVTSFLARADAH